MHCTVILSVCISYTYDSSSFRRNGASTFIPSCLFDKGGAYPIWKELSLCRSTIIRAHHGFDTVPTLHSILQSVQSYDIHRDGGSIESDVTPTNFKQAKCPRCHSKIDNSVHRYRFYKPIVDQNTTFCICMKRLRSFNILFSMPRLLPPL